MADTKNKIAIMQPYVFPYIGYFQLIQAVDVFVLYNDVNWINRGWINRNRILLNNEPFTFTIPCKKTSQNKLICETEINIDDKALGKILKTIERAYQKAPYFANVFPGISKVFQVALHLKTIDKLAEQSIRFVLDYLNIEKEIKNSVDNFAESKGMEKADRLIAICQKEHCNHYMNAPGGKDLYHKKYFEEQSIKLNFLETKPITYLQFNEAFSANLSIIDVLMFNSKGSVKNFLEQYELV